FTIKYNLDEVFLNYVFQELKYLNRNYEYHLLANHYLENAFALILGGAFFTKKKWLHKAKSIIENELNEQILADGAHFELSPMYHKIIFFRLLELIDWYSDYDLCDQEFLRECREKASLMRDWLENISFSTGDIPLFNDSANHIAFENSILLHYADDVEVFRCNM